MPRASITLRVVSLPTCIAPANYFALGEIRQPSCLAGLYHAIYGTDDFPQGLVGLESRNRVRELIGDEVETLVYVYAACDRSFTYGQIIREAQPKYRDRFTGRVFAFDSSLQSSLCELTLANELGIASSDRAHLERYRKRYNSLLGSFEGGA